MIEANYKTADGRITFRISAGTHKELFKEIAVLQETFEAERACGVCGSADIKFQLRTAGDKSEYEYFELVCKNPDCRARFSFGQSKDQKTLFPKRTDDEKMKGDVGFYLPNRGWVKYTPPSTQSHSSKGY